MTVVGIKRVEYFSKKHSRDVKGYTIYCNYEQDDVTGFATKDIFVNDNVIKNSGGYVPQIGDELGVYYNEYGTPTCIFKQEG